MNKNKLDKSVLVVYVITGFVSVSYLLHLILLWCNPHRGGQLNIFYLPIMYNFTRILVNFFTLLIFVYVLVITVLKIKADKEVK